MMQLPDRIVRNTEILGGKPTIRGTRISVELILELLAAGESEAQILDDYPGLETADIRACLELATRLVQAQTPEPALA